MDVQCLEDRQRTWSYSFHGPLQALEHSVFALVLPGHSHSSRSLSDIFLAGAGYSPRLGQ